MWKVVVLETIQHLWFACVKSKAIWKQVLEKFDIRREPRSWSSELAWYCRKASGRSRKCSMIRKLLATTIYVLWNERNAILFNQQIAPVQTLVNRITAYCK